MARYALRPLSWALFTFIAVTHTGWMHKPTLRGALHVHNTAALLGPLLGNGVLPHSSCHPVALQLRCIMCAEACWERLVLLMKR